MSAGDQLGCLDTLGIACLSDWDVLVFIYRHGMSLVSAGQIARLVGYDVRMTGDALDRLESLQLVRRSRVSGSARLYQFVFSTDPVRRDCFQQLMSLAENRTGRLLVARKLGQPARRQQRRGGGMVSIKR